MHKLVQRGSSYDELGAKIVSYISSVKANKPNVTELGTGTGILGFYVVKNIKR